MPARSREAPCRPNLTPGAPAAGQTGAVPEPLRSAFRRQVRARVLDEARGLVLDRGWDGVRMADVAAAAGLSRPTLYAQFGDRRGLGEALVLRELEVFLAGVRAALDAHAGHAEAALRAGVRFALEEGERNALLRAVLTSARAGHTGLLPLLTTDASVVLAAVLAVLREWAARELPAVPRDDVDAAADALARLTVSHLVSPSGRPAGEVAARLARVATTLLTPAAAPPAPQEQEQEHSGAAGPPLTAG